MCVVLFIYILLTILWFMNYSVASFVYRPSQNKWICEASFNRQYKEFITRLLYTPVRPLYLLYRLLKKHFTPKEKPMENTMEEEKKDLIKEQKELQKQIFDWYLETLKVQHPKLCVEIKPDRVSYHYSWVSYALTIDDLQIWYVAVGDIWVENYWEAKKELEDDIWYYIKYKTYFENKYKKQPVKPVKKKK